MKAEIEFDITQDKLVLSRVREMSANDLTAAKLRMADLTNQIDERKKHAKRMNRIIFLDAVRVCVHLGMLFALVFLIFK